jgi:hypothetical protein
VRRFRKSVDDGIDLMLLTVAASFSSAADRNAAIDAYQRWDVGTETGEGRSAGRRIMSTAFLKLWASRSAKSSRDGKAPSAAEVKPGHRYVRRRKDNVTELATVMDLKSDAVGIPHVRFALAFEKPSIGRVEAGLRMLALSAFIAAYCQRMA